MGDVGNSHVPFASSSNESELALKNNIFSIRWLSALCTFPSTFISCLISCLPSEHPLFLPIFPHYYQFSHLLRQWFASPLRSPVLISMRSRQHWFAWFTGYFSSFLPLCWPLIICSRNLAACVLQAVLVKLSFICIFDEKIWNVLHGHTLLVLDSPFLKSFFEPCANANCTKAATSVGKHRKINLSCDNSSLQPPFKLIPASTSQ